MKKLFIAVALLFLVLYPPNSSESKPENHLVKSTIANYEKVNHETLVNQFFMEYKELNKRVVKVENHLNK